MNYVYVFLFYIQTELNEDTQDTKNSAEAIRNFKPSEDKIPQTFRLMKVKGLQPWANTSSVSIADVIQVFFSNISKFIHSQKIYILKIVSLR